MFSTYDLRVEYVPGKGHTVADAMSRWAYPASMALQDCSIHGSREGAEEMRKVIEEEVREGRMVGLLWYELYPQKMLVMGALDPGRVVSRGRMFREVCSLIESQISHCWCFEQ